MSSNNTSSITNIISDGINSFVYSNASSTVIWSISIEKKCYDWVKEAYPDIFKEFEAIQDIERSLDAK